MNELDELLLRMADDFRRDYEDLSLIMAAIKQLAIERDGLTGKIAQLERRSEELQRKARKSAAKDSQ